MEPRPRSEKGKPPVGEIGFCVVLAGLAIVFLLKAASAEAREAESEVAAAVPCALILEVGGQVDVLDSSRTHLLPSSKRASVPCGGWISVGKGSAELKHRDGYVIHVGAGTFVQLPEPNLDGKQGGDHLILFKGQLFAQAGGGSQELRVITANARARVRRGSAIAVYNQDEEETQLIALDSQSVLENRFEPSRKVTAKAGEATSLNFKQLRVVPSMPRAVALAALRPKFDELHVPARDRTSAVHSAQARQERIFATSLVDGEKDSEKHAAAQNAKDEKDSHGDPSESPGNEVRERLKKSRQAQANPESYSKHVDPAKVQAVRKKWVSRLVAGESGAENIVTPVVAGGRKPASAGTAEQGAGAPGRSRGKARKLTPEDEEKLRLIDELSRLRDED